MDKVKFKADKMSGVAGTLYALSIVLGVVRMSNIRNKYHFPFYALTFDLDKGKCDEWFSDEGYEKVCNQIVADVKREEMGYFEGLEQKMRREANEFKKEVGKYVHGLDGLGDEELIDRYADFTSRYIYHYSIGAVSFLYEQILSERLAKSLAEHYKDAVGMMETLLATDYRSFMVEHEDWLHRIRGARSRGEKEKLARQYIDEFFYIKTSYVDAPELTVKSVLKEAEELEGKRGEGGGKLKNDFNDRELKPEERLLIDLFKITEVLRDKRKQINLIGSFGMFRFLDEVMRRTKAPFGEAGKIYWFEFGDWLHDTEGTLMRVKERKYATAVCGDGRGVSYLDYIAVEPRGVAASGGSELKGTPAAKGKAKGVVKIILGRDEFVNFREGDVLVAEMTRPDFVPIMKKAAAIVTDEGSLTCHAAIVSRELKIPCVVGTKIATQILKDGDLVEVDADRGIVRKIDENS